MSAHMDIETISRQLRNQKLLVKNLQNLCRGEGLSQVGTKPTLVNRLIERRSQIPLTLLDLISAMISFRPFTIAFSRLHKAVGHFLV